MQHYTLRWAIPSKPADNLIIIDDEGEGGEQYHMVIPFKSTRCCAWQMSHSTRARVQSFTLGPKRSTHPAQRIQCAAFGPLSPAHRPITLPPRIDTATRVMLENG